MSDNNMLIKPTEKTIRDILAAKKQYEIPRFQREYSWEKKHIKEFLSDMLDALRVDETGIKSSSYFIGTMLFIGDFSSQELQMKVVDGQQRLTTVTILFSVIAEKFRELGEKTLAHQQFQYIMRMDDDGKPMRVLKTKSSHPYFADFIQRENKEVDVEAVSDEEKCISNTYSFFCKQLEGSNLKYELSKRYPEQIEIIDGFSTVDILKVLRDQVLGSKLVSISTDTEKNAYKLFEILNAKGKSLANIDLIKNRLFEVLDEEEPSDFASEKWKELREKIGQGNEADILTTFYRHYWLSKYSNVTKGKLYDSFLKQIKKEEYKEFMQDLVTNSEHYVWCSAPNREYFNNRKEFFPIVQHLKNINSLEVIQDRVALLAVFDAYNKKLIKQSKLEEITQVLEDFHFIYNSLMKYSPNRLDKIYSGFAIELRKQENKESANSVIQEKLYDQLKKFIPEYNEFEKAFINLSYTKEDSTANYKTKYALNRINAYFQGKSLFEDDSSIEHILSEDTDEYAKNIGNLICLEREINTNAGNKSYIEKKEYYTKSSYTWVNMFVEQNLDWTQSKIEERAKALSKLYYDQIVISNLKMD